MIRLPHLSVIHVYPSHLVVDKSTSAKCASIVTSRLDGLVIRNETDPSAARHVATVRATTTRSKVRQFFVSIFSENSD